MFAARGKDRRRNEQISKEMAEVLRHSGPGETIMISPRQQRVFSFIRGYIQSNSVAPKFREIQDYFRYNSPSTVDRIIGILEREGLVERVPNVSRGIRLK
jgi:SOS-response transcriptional repressor LexA